MKKIISVLLMLVVIIVMFTACSSKEINIESCEWKLYSATNLEQDSAVVAVGKKDSAYPDAKVVNVVLSAKDGELVIEDKTNAVKHEGAYDEMFVTDSNDDYKILIKGKDGYANVFKTVYTDGSEEPTLLLTIGGYDLRFSAEIKNK